MACINACEPKRLAFALDLHIQLLVNVLQRSNLIAINLETRYNRKGHIDKLPYQDMNTYLPKFHS